MTKGINQKQKMLYLEKIFQEETDDDHGLTLQQIAEWLQKHGRHASVSLRVPGYGKEPSLRDDADVAMAFLQPLFGGSCACIGVTG